MAKSHFYRSLWSGIGVSSVWMMPVDRVLCCPRAAMSHRSAILNAIEHIHRAPLMPDGWARALAGVTAVTASEQGFITSFMPATRTAALVASMEVVPGHTAALVSGGAAGRWPKWTYTASVGELMQSSAMWNDNEYTRSAFYNEAIRPMGIFYGLVLPLLRTASRHVYLATGRRHGQDDYTDEDIAAHRLLVPHLETALRVSQRLAAADLSTRSAETALDQLGVGVVLVDAAATVLLANRIADSLLAARDGLRLGADDLGAGDPPALRTLHRMIAACGRNGESRIGGSPGGSVDLPRGGGRSSLRVLVAPVRWPSPDFDPGWALAVPPVALLLVSDLEQQRLRRRNHLRQRFDLTPTEADVVLELVRGDGRQAAARRLGIALPTLATHLQRAFDKTDTRRQAELVNLILRCVPSH